MEAYIIAVQYKCYYARVLWASVLDTVQRTLYIQAPAAAEAESDV